MDVVVLANKIEDRYRQYLKTTFYFRDSVLRTSFGDALDSGHLSKGPYLEATPVFKRTLTPRILFQSLLGSQPGEGFLKAVDGDRPLYQHQEEAIQQVFTGQNAVIATGTGSGKTEAFIYPILLEPFSGVSSWHTVSRRARISPLPNECPRERSARAPRANRHAP